MTEERSRTTVLVVDDEPELLSAVSAGLSANGFIVLTAKDGRQGLDVCSSSTPDILLVDLTMPRMDGMELIRLVRTTSDVPIIVISVHGAEQRKIEALNLGADDYLTKPFGMGELTARVQANLRRSRPEARQPSSQRLEIGELTLDLEARRVTRAGEPIHLTPTEFDLLAYFVEHQGKVLRHRAILISVWGQAYADDTPSLRVMVRQLRRKLERDPSLPQLIETEPGIGYRFTPRS